MIHTSRLDEAELRRAAEIVADIRSAMTSQLVGQTALQRALLATLISNGHVLLESVPGLAKTLAASALAASVRATFSRVQCTPDLLPSDIIGTQVFDASTSSFTTQLGPVHSNFVLLDEINRSSAKTQSAMLEAMQERQTSIGGQTYPLPKPFMVLATQNPIDEEGTYVLPQAQMDRFLLKEVVSYPTPSEELEVLKRIQYGQLGLGVGVEPRLSVADVEYLQHAAARVHVDESINQYIIEVMNVSRDPGYFLGADKAKYIEYGASPRGSIAFLVLARALALMAGRDHVIPEDVTTLRYPVLRHRIILTFEAVAERVKVEDLIDEIFGAVPTP